jgi:hypothetical protein
MTILRRTRRGWAGGMPRPPQFPAALITNIREVNSRPWRRWPRRSRRTAALFKDLLQKLNRLVEVLGKSDR